MAEYRFLAPNEVLFQQGDDPDNMYLIRSGIIEIYIEENGQTKTICELGAGDLVGEMGLFNQGTRSTHARATGECSLLLFPYKHMEEQVTGLPEWVRIMMRTLSERLKRMNQIIP